MLQHGILCYTMYYHNWGRLSWGVLSIYPMSRRSVAGSRHTAVKQKEATDNMDLVSKPRSKSIVWLYFGLKADERGQPLNSGEAVCRLCRKIVLAKGGNTTNLRSHLRRRHRADFFETTSSTTPGSLFETQGDSSLYCKEFRYKMCKFNSHCIDHHCTCMQQSPSN